MRRLLMQRNGDTAAHVELESLIDGHVQIVRVAYWDHHAIAGDRRWRAGKNHGQRCFLLAAAVALLAHRRW